MDFNYEEVPMLDINGISIGYGSVEVVHGVTMHVDEGKIIALIGPNGAGKSSVLKAISGMLRPSSGDIVFLGTSLIGSPPHEIAAAGIAHVMEGRHLFGGLTVEDNLLLAGASDASSSAGSMEAVYQRWPVLKERRQQLAGNLSGGEQQMLAIGRALIGRPRLVVLDEPSWGLAPKVVRDLMKTILELRSEGMTILLVEQMANLALKICDYGYVMSNGKIVLEGSAQALLSHPDLQASYLGGKASLKMPPLNAILVPPRRPIEAAKDSKPEEKVDYRLREVARQEKESSTKELISSSPMASSLSVDAPQEAQKKGFEEKERARQTKEKSFGSREPFPDIKDELERIHKELLELKRVQVVPQNGTSFPRTYPQKEREAFERQRLEKQANREAGLAPEPEIRERIKKTGLEFRDREMARIQREKLITREAKEASGLKSSNYEDRERERQRRQEDMKHKPRPTKAEEPGFVPSPKGVMDRKTSEMKRNEKEEAFSGRLKGAEFQKTGDHGEDRRAQELAREQREAARQKKQMGPVHES
jgi:branched-chain amino acid transport system ATP-binding protein